MKSDGVGLIDGVGVGYLNFAESKDFIALATSSDTVGFITPVAYLVAKLYSVRLRMASPIQSE